MKKKSNTIESIMEKLYKIFPDEKVDEILNAASREISKEEMEEIPDFMKPLYERLDFSKKSFEERKKMAFGIFIQEIMEQKEHDKE